MFGLGATELIIILVIVLIIFGAGKLPQIGDALGRSIKNFKKAADTGSELDVTPKKELGDSGKGTTDKVADKAERPFACQIRASSSATPIASSTTRRPASM